MVTMGEAIRWLGESCESQCGCLHWLPITDGCTAGQWASRWTRCSARKTVDAAVWGEESEPAVGARPLPSPLQWGGWPAGEGCRLDQEEVELTESTRLVMIRRGIREDNMVMHRHLKEVYVGRRPHSAWESR